MANEKFCCTWVALADVTSKPHQSQWLQETLSCQISLSFSLSLHERVFCVAGVSGDPVLACSACRYPMCNICVGYIV
ncbi:hypothetical protein EUGRSUZ_G01941 [Eucalyptus grandis]|uniref:Uncharacterized protein n=2 Tax=Eucalyptus grandis TaxID=71139 RepID=A0ACC3K4X1_EUCGR|nr:hypothetical protein EUGRSUZ_G01941 [Eucalyptus grandis]